MSACVDEERKAVTREEKDERIEKVLRECLSVVTLRREGVQMKVIAERLERGRATVYRRLEASEDLERFYELLLRRIERAGLKGAGR